MMMLIGALVSYNSGEEEIALIDLRVLISALKVHGYLYGDISIISRLHNKDRESLSAESSKVMTCLTFKIMKALEVYVGKLSMAQQIEIKRKHVDLVSMVLLAQFDEIIENRTQGK